ncbi:hypothetical protein SynA1544_02506 [Synechococcus sp. A15-44]|nr:hypothetical protein SynA1544_02506 [Synechococcus sp. A15-44]
MTPDRTAPANDRPTMFVIYRGRSTISVLSSTEAGPSATHFQAQFGFPYRL